MEPDVRPPERGKIDFFHFNPRAPCGARRACVILSSPSFLDFNPRAPCGARLSGDFSDAWEKIISIHGLRVEPDPAGRKRLCRRENFNPRAPCGARPEARSRPDFQKDFNPRAPCGARRGPGAALIDCEIFQSTGSVWSPTRGTTGRRRCKGYFNPRAPCGARLETPTTRRRVKYFNPRAPCGARQDKLGKDFDTKVISIHGLRVEPDRQEERK